MPFTLAHAAGNMFFPDKRRRSIYTTATEHGDVLTFTEAKKDHEFIHDIDGFSDAKVDELAILWRSDLFTMLDHGSRMVMVGGKHNKRRRGPNRYVLWVVLAEKATGIQWLVGTHHAIAKADTSFLWRRSLRAAGFRNAGAELKAAHAEHPDAFMVLTGDWNTKRGVDFGLGLTEAKTPATFGRALRYDRIQHEHDVRVTGVKAVAGPGDHKMLVAKVATAGHVTPPPVPAPTPEPTPAPVPVPTPTPKPEATVSIEQAIANARDQAHNGPKFGVNECKMRCRLLYDVDSDGSPDATAAWKRTKFKHDITTLKAIPRGALIWWTGGSSGHGHVALSAGGGRCWSTDIKRKGFFDNVPIGAISKAWPKVKIAGWSEDIDGVRVMVAGGPAERPPVTPTPKPKPGKPKPNLAGFKPRIDGIDISHHQGGKIDWPTAKANGVRFVYHKATEGKTFRDGNYSKRRNEVGKCSGVAFGAYHFARPGSSSGTEQAKFFLSVAAPKKGDLRPCLDLEDTGGLSWATLTTWVEQFAAEVERVTGKPPVLYMPSRFELTRDPGCFLWVPRYNDANALPVIPKPYDRWTIWQFSNGQFGNPKAVPGVGHVDINTLAPGFDLKRLTI